MTGLETNVVEWQNEQDQLLATPARPRADSDSDAKASAKPTPKPTSPVVDMDTTESRVVPPRIQSPRQRRHKIPAHPSTSTDSVDTDIDSPSANDLASSDSSYSPPTPHDADDDDVDVLMSDVNATTSATVCRTLRRRQRQRDATDGGSAMSDDEDGVASPNGTELHTFYFLQ